MNIVAIQDGLASAVRPLPGLRQAFGRPVDDINPSTFMTMEFDIARHQTMGGSKLLNFTCLLLTSRGDTDAGQQALGTFLSEGDSDICAALEADQFLGGVSRQLIVDGVSGAGRLFLVGEVQYLGAEINVRVWAV